ncbi:MAG: PQQ-binding-like beta-propeller repeat protein [Anaerolineae bacterium]|nr:PQQ-binding-like beta-propeller repeat protein [Anaerolineae bacterium]
MKSWLSFLCGVLFLLACSHEMPVEKNGESQLPQWPMFGKNLRHTSNAADPVEYYPGPKNGKIVWTVDFGFSEECFTTPSIGPSGTIYMATTPVSVMADTIGFIYAINPNGTIKWRFKTKRGNFADGAVGLDGTYYIGSRDRFFYAIEKDGNLKWKREFPLSSFQANRPAITLSGDVIVSVSTAIIALNERTGETLWSYELPGTSDLGVSLDVHGNIYAGTTNSILALSPGGKKRWEFSNSSTAYDIVIAYDGTIFFTVLYDSLLYALNPTGDIRFTFNMQGSLGHVPAISRDGSIIILNSQGNLYRLDNTGHLLQTIEMRRLLGTNDFFISNNNPIIDQDGTIYLSVASTVKDNFYAVSRDDTIKWSLTIESPNVVIYPTPAIAPEGTMYVVGYHSISAIR